MRSPQLYPFKFPPGHIHGYRKDGRPIYAVAGGSEGPTDSGPAGTTITVPRVTETPPPTSNNAPTTATTTTNGLTIGSGHTFTADDLEKARQQEKDKLYERLNKQDEVLKKLQEERDARIAAEEEARKKAEAEAEAARQENLTFTQKLDEAQKTWEQRLADMQNQLAQRDALLAREREYQSLQEYRATRLKEESENIMPELQTWVAGNSQQEIDDAVTRAKETTAAILSQVTQAQAAQQYAQQQARQQARGTGVTSPPVGPMDNQSGYETFTVDQLREMDLTTYAKHRARLLEAASQQHMRGRG